MAGPALPAVPSYGQMKNDTGRPLRTLLCDDVPNLECGDLAPLWQMDGPKPSNAARGRRSPNSDRRRTGACAAVVRGGLLLSLRRPGGERRPYQRQREFKNHYIVHISFAALRLSAALIFPLTLLAAES